MKIYRIVEGPYDLTDSSDKETYKPDVLLGLYTNWDLAFSEVSKIIEQSEDNTDRNYLIYEHESDEIVTSDNYSLMFKHKRTWAYDERFTIYKDSHNKKCPSCNKDFKCLTDSYGGGSHYWTLMCDNCDEIYDYGNHDSKLRPLKDSPIEWIEYIKNLTEKKD